MLTRIHVVLDHRAKQYLHAWPLLRILSRLSSLPISALAASRSPTIRPRLCQRQPKGNSFLSPGPRACVGCEMAWMQGKLFIVKVLWVFDVVKVAGPPLELEKTLHHYGIFEKPDIRVRFVPAKRSDDSIRVQSDCITGWSQRAVCLGGRDFPLDMVNLCCCSRFPRISCPTTEGRQSRLLGDSVNCQPGCQTVHGMEYAHLGTYTWTPILVVNARRPRDARKSHTKKYLEATSSIISLYELAVKRGLGWTELDRALTFH